MIQTFIIRSDIHPKLALKTGDDRSVCGDCPKRPSTFVPKSDGDKPCYVDVAKSVASVFRCFAKGNYPRVTPQAARALFADRELRLGAYGNPSAAPFALWAVVASRTSGRTGGPPRPRPPGSAASTLNISTARFRVEYDMGKKRGA
jgi:hypothetical protein